MLNTVFNVNFLKNFVIVTVISVLRRMYWVADIEVTNSNTAPF